MVDGAYHFDLITEQHELKDLRLGMPGRHNVENAIAASTIALRLGVTPSSLREGLNSFRGVSRRFETRIRDKGIVYIDDYAHHPKELDACIASVREMYPGRRVTGIFQPHLYSRTRDLAADFAQSLAALDELILLEVYPAREEPIEGIDSTWLLDQVPMENKVVRAREDVIDHLRNKELDVVVTLGAGDIDRLVLPIQQLLNQRIRS